MKTKYLFIVLGLIFNLKTFASSGSGTSGVGNGGDTVRDSFFLIGRNIIESYKNGLISISDELKKNGITDYNQLEKFLSIDVVHTITEILHDNQGSVVSAIGIPGSITLYIGNELPAVSWNSILLDRFKSERLVLHEMLRATGVNDDNYAFTNIVLKDQGRISNDRYNFIWSKNNEGIIASALANSFNSKDLKSELASFRDVSAELTNRNELKYSELIKIYAQFLINLDFRQSNIDANQKQLLSSYRETFRNLREVNSTVDLFALNRFNNDAGQLSYLIKYFILSLKQIPNAMFVFSEIDQISLLEYIQSLIALSSGEYASNNLTMLTTSLYELESMIQNNPSRESILKKNMQIIRMLQNLNK